MALSNAVITFNPAEGEFDTIKFALQGTGSLIISSPVDYDNFAQSVAEYLNANYESVITAGYAGDDLTVTAVNEGVTISNVLISFQGSIFTIYGDVVYNNDVPASAYYTGLESDRYLINNPIFIGLNSSEETEYYSILLENLTNQKTSTTHYIYADANSYAQVNIAPIVKSLFDVPQHSTDYVSTGQIIRNANQFKITIIANGVSTILNKTFIRGGKRTDNTNQTLPALATLRPSALLPVWTGYDTADYILNANNQIIKRLLLEVSVNNIDYRRSKGCNELYVLFANQQGGYSSWLFDTNEQTHSAQSLGAFIRQNKPSDLGATADFKLKAVGKIPVEYKSLIDDLIDSPEIYAFIESAYVRVTAGRNTINEDPSKRSYNVTLNFDFNFRYNPSLLWSN